MGAPSRNIWLLGAPSRNLGWQQHTLQRDCNRGGSNTPYKVNAVRVAATHPAT